MSQPSIEQNSNHDQFDVISDDIPAVINYVQKQTEQPINIVCHSWGGGGFFFLVRIFVRKASIIASLVLSVSAPKDELPSGIWTGY